MFDDVSEFLAGIEVGFRKAMKVFEETVEKEKKKAYKAGWIRGKRETNSESSKHNRELAEALEKDGLTLKIVER